MAIKLKNKSWSLILLLVFASVIISMTAGIINTCTYPYTIYFGATLIMFAWLLGGTAILAFTAYVYSKKHVKVSPEWCLIWLLLYLFLILFPPHIYNMRSFWSEIYYSTLNTQYHYIAPICFSAIILPFSFIFVLNLCRLTALIRQGKLRENSALLKFVIFLGRKKSIRSRIFILVFLVNTITALTSIAALYVIIYVNSLTINLNNMWFFMLMPIVLELIILTGLLCSSKSLGSDMDKVADIITGTNAGNFITDNPLPPGSILYDTGDALIKLGEITSDGIQKGIAGEKLKVELITNVSHDLRTPLTSIIGYCEQLEAVKDLPPEALEYIHRLGSKACYLSNMTDDLFDLAKAASGNADIILTELNVHKLIEQTLGEMNEQLEQSGFVIKLNLAADNAMVLADGMRLHRVIQNLIDNALKYALKGTRIFISSENTADTIIISILNTASYEMDFGNKNLTERFCRGDSSRTGEGSGLGLAIAKTYTEALGGRFDINIKGDQFEAIIVIPNVY